MWVASLICLQVFINSYDLWVAGCYEHEQLVGNQNMKSVFCQQILPSLGGPLVSFLYICLN